MITWTTTAVPVLSVTKPAPTSLTLIATTDTVGSTVNFYRVDSIDPTMPTSVVITADLTGIHVSGDSSLAFSNGKQMDYANPDGSLGTATIIADIPKTSALYNFHVDPRVSQIYTFTVSAFEGTGIYDPLAVNVYLQKVYQIKIFNEWNSNKTDILNILAGNY